VRRLLDLSHPSEELEPLAHEVRDALLAELHLCCYGRHQTRDFWNDLVHLTQDWVMRHLIDFIGGDYYRSAPETQARFAPHPYDSTAVIADIKIYYEEW
jgi:hypothetical protein